MNRSHSAIVLRKVDGRFEACHSATSRVFRPMRSAMFGALAFGLLGLLLPLALIGAAIAIATHGVALPALAFAGKALLGKLALGKLAAGKLTFAITAPVAGDAKKAHDELLS